ncbi:MAG TPA: rRNA maturation RNase YbeY [Burkholderiales bacterium]|nr:rRNA maturation RNase YbeY [Burkholderiales bacterium]
MKSRSSRGAGPRLRLALQNPARSRSLPPAARFRRWARAALERDADITLRVVGEPEGRRLNRDFRGSDHATNVLTFVYGERAPLAGDIVLCAPVVRREARSRGIAAEAHYAHLTVHGTLHLQGYDHVRRRETEAMEALESRILLRLGYADPHAGDEG